MWVLEEEGIFRDSSCIVECDESDGEGEDDAVAIEFFDYRHLLLSYSNYCNVRRYVERSYVFGSGTRFDITRTFGLENAKIHEYYNELLKITLLRVE